MNIVSIEPTPSPNTMKLNLDSALPAGQANNYTHETKHEAPEMVQRLFDIEGIKGVYHVADFIALERHPKADWQVVLQNVRSLFGSGEETVNDASATGDNFGEVQVHQQVFKGIPMQIKLTSGEEEKRVGLPERFSNAAFAAQTDEDNVVMQRKWEERGVRYGSDLEEIAAEVYEEITAAYSEERLQTLAELGRTEKEAAVQKQERYMKVTKEMLDDPDWKNRYAALDRMDPGEEDLPVLEKALQDEKPAVRRLAVAYLGMIEKPVVLPYLYKALKDSSVTVRRTAGDCVSDIGDPSAMDEMIHALEDKNKLVRWRAAMFLYEAGDERAVLALEKAEEDSAFEVAMQAKIAKERIERGEEAKGSIWKQMTEAVQNRE
ncbi:HEAT repeat protein [Salsuginibacillus halophilus]|uniref:HEAT repeat protein n=1 Tax=Salsuginibacillus halophilus TaxID=517424 RepID=A0A2P8HWJ0_9BACI|nr:conserved virulence factor C family protein [Salsuginibacillus halophilus]PSL50558.1 HEAT repeat protein [Salsuginibacillus halophilus]